ncbi:MAG: polymer-forming cytoskeletal protein [Spirochaetes bacterium]|nr:polymer-forming cytoskeletal protein [Spirochaetota bacterium]
MKPDHLAGSRLAEEMVANGHLSFSTAVTLRGRFSGTIEGTGHLVVAQGAEVHARITARVLTIAGLVVGDCHAEERVELLGSARLIGNVRTRALKLADGVDFEGQSEMIR